MSSGRVRLKQLTPTVGGLESTAEGPSKPEAKANAANRLLRDFIEYASLLVCTFADYLATADELFRSSLAHLVYSYCNRCKCVTLASCESRLIVRLTYWRLTETIHIRMLSREFCDYFGIS